MMANRKNDQYIQTYIGLSAAQIQVIAANGVFEGRSVPFAEASKTTKAALIGRKLFTEDGRITELGKSVCVLHEMIDRKVFEPQASQLNKMEIDLLSDPQRIARQPEFKETGLASIHVKFLRALLLVPGASIFHMEKVYGVYVFADLISRGLASRGTYSHQIYPTDAGVRLIKECIARAMEERG